MAFSVFKRSLLVSGGLNAQSLQFRRVAMSTCNAEMRCSNHIQSWPRVISSCSLMTSRRSYITTTVRKTATLGAFESNGPLARTAPLLWQYYESGSSHVNARATRELQRLIAEARTSQASLLARVSAGENIGEAGGRELGMLSNIIDKADDLEEMTKEIRELQSLMNEAEEDAKKGSGEDEMEAGRQLAILAKEECDDIKEARQHIAVALLLALLKRQEKSEVAAAGGDDGSGGHSRGEATGAIVEVRAGTGGDEAGLFARELFEMYAKYGRAKGWQVEHLSFAVGGLGELQEGVLAIKVRLRVVAAARRRRRRSTSSVCPAIRCAS